MIESICSLESELWVRRLVSVLAALVLTAANVAFMIPCLETKECVPSTTLNDGEVEEPLVLPNRGPPGQHDDCRMPVFFIPFVAVLLFGITLLTYLGFWLKSLIIVSILLLHATLMLATPLKAEMECSERLVFNDEYRYVFDYPPIFHTSTAPFFILKLFSHMINIIRIPTFDIFYLPRFFLTLSSFFARFHFSFLHFAEAGES